MIRYLRNKRAQVMIGEYAIVIFLVFAVVTAITVYFKRAVQARIRDARYHMVSEVRKRTAGQYDGKLSRTYEPYYADTRSKVTRRSGQTTKILPGVSSGIFEKDSDEFTKVRTSSKTAPPRKAD